MLRSEFDIAEPAEETPAGIARQRSLSLRMKETSRFGVTCHRLANGSPLFGKHRRKNLCPDASAADRARRTPFAVPIFCWNRGTATVAAELGGHGWSLFVDDPGVAKVVVQRALLSIERRDDKSDQQDNTAHDLRQIARRAARKRQAGSIGSNDSKAQ